MMGSEFHFRDKVAVAVLGATGRVGQKFIELLARHPWFDMRALAASDRSLGKPYKEAVNWLMPAPLPPEISEMQISPCLPELPYPLVFSALDAAVAGEVETAFAKNGSVVVSNARNHRMDSDVPLVIPEVNPSHTELLKQQPFNKGKIVTVPNCSAVGLCLALKPLQDKFGLEAVHVVTLQAVSGAGYPGISGLDILDNVVPYIKDEEQKLQEEPFKILGDSQLKISAQCNRVPVLDGHVECVSVKLKNKASRQQIIEAWEKFSGLPQTWNLPSAPTKPIYYFKEDHHPQPRLHRQWDKGMAVCIGRLRECELLDYKFVLLSHNTIRGAAGGAILTAELLLRQGFIFW